ncbi:enolase C-terminal domain-like protein [Mesobacterium pallidum]|uniref:enolase C-terminal domain-like protein n=1 Tax=Mesobacterium pallidum TaxID=2872037 RepID=UPI001EE3000F|nr:enolase C-terminal domain-like protein [Mesobacterium pallidum]
MERFGGCLLESGIGTAAHLAVFDTVPALERGCEHFGPSILRQDHAASGISYRDFHVDLPQGPGPGITVDMDALKDATRKA